MKGKTWGFHAQAHPERSRGDGAGCGGSMAADLKKSGGGSGEGSMKMATCSRLLASIACTRRCRRRWRVFWTRWQWLRRKVATSATAARSGGFRTSTKSTSRGGDRRRGGGEWIRTEERRLQARE